MVVVGDQPAHVFAEEPAGHDHQEVEDADDDQETHPLPVRRAPGESQRQRDGERVETQSDSQQ